MSIGFVVVYLGTMGMNYFDNDIDDVIFYFPYETLGVLSIWSFMLS